MNTKRLSQRLALLGVGVAATATVLAPGAMAQTVAAQAVPASSGAATPCPAVKVFYLVGTYAFDELPPYATIDPHYLPPPSKPGNPNRAVEDLTPDKTGGAVDFQTVDYPASAGLPGETPRGAANIFDSHVKGVAAAEAAIQSFVQQCPTGQVSLLGYSQGAWSAGDVLVDIANNRVSGVPASKIRSSYLIADPVNQAAVQPTANFGVFVGTSNNHPPAGVLSPRPTFGPQLSPNTFEICTAGDGFCDSPSNGNPGNAYNVLINPPPAHTTYPFAPVGVATSGVQFAQRGLADGIIPANSQIRNVTGAIGARYQQPGVSTILGQPISVEHGVNSGTFVRFQYGDIYNSTQTGAYEIAGAINNQYAIRGWENGSGYPTSAELPAVNGRYQNFRLLDGNLGAMYWSPATNARYVQGAILAKYRSLGAETNTLGYPTTDEQSPDNDTRISYFEHGKITFKFSTGQTTVN